MLQEAVNISNENVDRAMSVAHKLAIQLRAAEEQIAQLQGEMERLESRAARAERWLETIKQEIEDKLIAPMEANRPELPVLH
jgi:chromosome segregation ATPase